MKKYVALKLVGLVILTMAILVVISILEVAVYSYVVNPSTPELIALAIRNGWV